MTFLLSRRATTLGAVALVLASGVAPGMAATGSRQLVLLRGSDEIGSQSLVVTQTGATVSVETRISIDARLLGLPVYRYLLEARETWEDGALQTLEARTDDNGTAHFVDASRAGDELRINGSVFSGAVSGNPATTSYWSPAFLERPVWISTQDGRPLNVTATQLAAAPFPSGSSSVAATPWRIGGDLSDLVLFYDPDGEWIGSEFAARGETARFVTASRGSSLTPLWVDA